MAKVKYYGVKRGMTRGVYETWPECQAQVLGYKGAEYKSFKTHEEAEAYVCGIILEQPTIKPEVKTKAKVNKVVKKTNPDTESLNQEINKFIIEMENNEIAAFVDGSYNLKEKIYGSGVVMIDNMFNEVEFHKMGKVEQYLDARNVAGETKGAELAIKYAIKHNYTKITIFYDYAGIEKWAKGQWKTNKPVSIDYVKEIDKLKKAITIDFVKVAAHSDIYYNECADELAKLAAGV